MKEFWNNLKFTWKYCKGQKWNLIKYIIANIIDVGINIAIPILSAKVIVSLTDSDFYQLVFMALVIFFIEILRNFVRHFANYNAQVLYRENFINLQTELGKNILTLENKTLDDNGSGVFIQRLTGDTGKLADVFGMLSAYLSNFITNIGIFVAVFIISKSAFVYLFVMIFVLFIIERTKTKKANVIDKEFRDKNDKVSGFVGEIVRGARDIKMLNAEESFISELHTKVVDLNNTRYKLSGVRRNYTLFRTCMNDIFDLFLIILLIILIVNYSLPAASALIIYNYTGNLTGFIYWVGQLLENVKSFNLSSSRIYSIIDSKEFKKEKFGKVHLDKVEGNFEFKDVKFNYGKVKVLDGLNFKIKANETVAFVGKSGAGKTTIFNLLCKMFDIKHGEITIDGINIKKLDRESIRGNITIISQDPYIFNVSIRDNLKLVKPDLTEEEMFDACKAACLYDFIINLPEGFDTIVGEGGVNLSGGQKQRLAIARALVQKTEIILFDEATSSLDNETQESIQQAIDNMKNEYTILIIAHRLSTIVNSSRILVLDDGKIVAEGTHKQLLRRSKVYKHLYESELNKKE